MAKWFQSWFLNEAEQHAGMSAKCRHGSNRQSFAAQEAHSAERGSLRGPLCCGIELLRFFARGGKARSCTCPCFCILLFGIYIYIYIYIG